MKEKLLNRIAKAKEELENYLSQVNVEIITNEKINKGITKLKNEIEKI